MPIRLSNRLAALAWGAVAFALPLASLGAESTALNMPKPKTFQFTQTKTAEVNYLLFLPNGYDPTNGKKWPLILFLHGAGERGNDVSRVGIHGPLKVAPQQKDFPFIVVGPQCPADQTWSRDVVIGLLDDVLRAHAVDPQRVYLTGLSMGGYGTWDIGLSYPERFAAIAPICGGGQLITVLLGGREKAEAMKTLPVWAFHGAKDTVVPLAESEKMLQWLKRAGVKDAKLTVYPEAGHDSWTEAYNDAEFYRWLLSKKR